MQSLYNQNTGYESNGSFKRTNFILKEAAAKIWSTYSVAGTTEFKPYPVFDANGVPCPPRLTSQYEVNGEVPDAESLSADQIREYEDSIFPPAFIRVPTVTWVGKDGVQFIDLCPDIANYQSADEDRIPATPYTTMVRTLSKLIPTDKYQGDGRPCPPTLARAKNARKGQIGLKMSSESILIRGALMRVKGKVMETKSSVNGVLWRACLLISQKSATNAMRNKYAEKTNPAAPISADNFPLSGIFHPQGTFLSFTKSDPTNDQSVIVVKPGYSQEFNQKLAEFFSNDVGQYFAKVREDLGAFQDMASMLELMTVQQQIDLILDQFPASWVWYGLRDSRYNELIPPEVRNAALKDPEWAERFGVTTPAAQVNHDSIPMNYGQPSTYVPPVTPRVEPPPQGYGVPTAPPSYGVPQVPPNVQKLVKEASVEYQPKTQSSPDSAVADIIKKYR